MRIVIAEEDAALAVALHDGLRDEGLVVEWGNSGAEPPGTGHYELLVLDPAQARRPRTDVLHELRQGNGGVPVLIVAVRGEPADRITGDDGGADDYLVDPTGLDQLLERVRNVLSRLAERPNPVLR